jgi:hypothetical protein
MDTAADDLSMLIGTLALKGALLIGFSAGGGEVARIGRRGTRAARLIRDHEAELASPRSMRWTLSWAHARHTPGEPSVARSFRPGWGRRSEDSRRAVRQLWRRFLGCSA